MKRRNEVLVGILTTVAVVVGVLGAIWLARGGLSAGYPLYSIFPWGAGLKQGQPVLLVGVNVGYVDGVELKYDGTLVTTYRIQDKYRVPLGASATVVANGIFGDMAIALTLPGPNPRSHEPGDTIPTGVSPPNITQLTARMDTITASLGEVVAATKGELVDSGGVADLRRTLASANRLAIQLSSVVETQSRQLATVLQTVRRTASAVDSAAVDSTVRNLRAASASFTQLATDLRTTTERFNSVLAKVDNGDGTASKLLSDPALYNDVRRLLTRFDSLTVEFQRNPRKFVNLSIF